MPHNCTKTTQQTTWNPDDLWSHAAPEMSRRVLHAHPVVGVTTRSHSCRRPRKWQPQKFVQLRSPLNNPKQSETQMQRIADARATCSQKNARTTQMQHKCSYLCIQADIAEASFVHCRNRNQAAINQFSPRWYACTCAQHVRDRRAGLGAGSSRGPHPKAEGSNAGRISPPAPKITTPCRKLPKLGAVFHS